MRWILPFLFCAALWAAAAQAQSDDNADRSDQGFIAGLLEDSLGGDGRVVRIDGFRGALSSTAEIDRITIADPQGVWLTMDGLTMEWSRSALLRGRIDITALRADVIELARAPLAPDDGLPEAEASGFALPDLPVAIDIKALEVRRFVLGAPVLGAAAGLSLSAAALYDSDVLSLKFAADRIDGNPGRFEIDGRFARAEDTLALTLSLSEAEGGIAARLLGLPDMPSVAMTIAGTGPLSDYDMSINLDTAGTDRVDGTVRISGEAADASDTPARVFDVDLTGDLAPLVAAEFRPFFGAATTLQARGTRADDGVLDLENLSLQTGALNLDGALRLASDGWPEEANLALILRDPGGAPVTLPVSGGQTRIARADLSLTYDAATNDRWQIGGTVDGFASPDLSVARADLSATGEITDRTIVDGRFEVDATGLGFASSALQRAAGEAIGGVVNLRVAPGAPVTLSDLAVRGEDYRLLGDITVGGVDQNFETALDLRLQADRLARFDQLAGTAIGGAADVAIVGTLDLGGAANITVDGTAQDLGFGIAQADGLFAGTTTLRIRAERDGEGTRLPQVDMRNRQLSVAATADLQSGRSNARFDLAIPDGTVIDPMLKGAVTLAGSATGQGDTWRIAARATAPYDSVATVNGAVTGPEPAIDFDLSLPDVSPLVPDISGALSISGAATQTDLGWLVDANASGPYAARASVNGRVTGDAAPDIAFDLSLPDVRPVAPGLSGPANIEGRAQQREEGLAIDTAFRGPFGASGTVAGVATGDAPRLTFSLRLPDIASLGSPVGGPLTVSGTANQIEGAWRIATDLTGPGGANATIGGTVASANAIDVTAQGSVPLALATPLIAPRSLQGMARFDLRHSGAASLGNLSGQISTRGARLSAPTVAVALNGLDADVTLTGGRAQISAQGDVSTGGLVSVSGQVGLTGDLASDLVARLNAVRLRDPNLYDTVLNGALTVRGPLAGRAVVAGRIDVGDTQVQVPNATGGGFSIVPQIAHVGASPAVRQTISRAGLDQSDEADAATAGPGYGLDLTISAPSRVFVRGRGLDTELGGQVTLRGTTNNVVSVGRFSLIRGRLDVLGKRFVLDEGTISLQGQLDPFLRFVATTGTEAGTAQVIIEGPVSAPEVRFEATPEAPQDEVLAQIFFGRSLGTLSPFQALQLASAVAQLAGKGGESLVSRLRRGFDLDDFDVTTDEEGQTGVRFGKYLSENVYTDVTVGSSEDAGVSLNIDLTPNLTARGTQKADGESSIGIFFERDY